MCWRDDIATTRHCSFCGETYYGDLGHRNCPGLRASKPPERDSVPAVDPSRSTPDSAVAVPIAAASGGTQPLPRTGIEVRPGVYHVAPNDGDERPDEDEFTEPRRAMPNVEAITRALADLPDDTPLMQVTETAEAWGGKEIGERESGVTVGDLRNLLAALPVSPSVEPPRCDWTPTFTFGEASRCERDLGHDGNHIVLIAVTPPAAAPSGAPSDA